MASNHPVKLQSTINESDLSYDKLIGYGGGGEVYRATWTSESRGRIPVAAKKIPILEGSSSKLGNEIALLQQLDHPNIIKYYGHVVTKDHVVIVMEYASNGSLYDFLKNKKSLSPELKSKWAIQGARAIKCLQDNLVLHRDIKPQNFLITADDNLKLCDFGISKILTSTKPTTSEKGTVKWLAPEQFTKFQLSPTADIFAFGIVLWELETCQEPYPDMPPMTVMYKVGNEGLRPEIPATCSSVLRDLMQRCWDGDRAKRPSINEIIHQLQRYKDGGGEKRHHEAVGSGSTMARRPPGPHQFCAGGHLAHYMSGWKTRISRSVKLNIMKDIAAAITYLHKQRVVHRDIKAQNVLVAYRTHDTLDVTAKLADFGLAKVIENCNFEETYYMDATCGTKYYLAPEVINGHYTEKADVFSMAVLFTAIVTESKIPGHGYMTSYIKDEAGKIWSFAEYMTMTKTDVAMRSSFTAGENLRSLLNSMLLYDYHKRPTADEVCSTMSDAISIENIPKNPKSIKREGDRPVPSPR